MRLLRACLYSFLLLAACIAGRAETISVNTQAGFDRLQASFDSVAVRSPKVIHICLGKGVFYYRENHFSLIGRNHPDLRLIMEGNGTVLVPEGRDFILDTSHGRRAPYDRDFRVGDGFVSLARMQTTDFRDPVKKALSQPVPVSLRHRLFYIRCQEQDLSEADAKDTYVILSQWYVGAVYKVKEIRRGRLYFYAVPRYGTKLYEELRYGRCRPRYILYNQRSNRHPSVVGGVLSSPSDEYLHRCEASRFLSLESARLKSFRMEGIRFLGNRDGEDLIRLDKTVADSIVLTQCVFEGIRSDAVRIIGTGHVRIQGCHFEKCYRKGVFADYRSEDVRIVSNRFHDHGLALSTAPAVHCQCRGFLISDNLFEDFSYSAIGLGTHYMESDRPYAEGIVERNEICQTEAFRKPPMRVLVDSGAIYVWTQNRNVIIRENYIHDISGPHGNRGILCDDGAVNVSIHDNLIRNIDHHSYCIDLRRNYSVERSRISHIRRVNVGNRMWGNWVDGRVRFHIRKNDPRSFRKPNVHLEPGLDRDDVYRRWLASLEKK